MSGEPTEPSASQVSHVSPTSALRSDSSSNVRHLDSEPRQARKSRNDDDSHATINMTRHIENGRYQRSSSSGHESQAAGTYNETEMRTPGGFLLRPLRKSHQSPTSTREARPSPQQNARNEEADSSMILSRDDTPESSRDKTSTPTGEPAKNNRFNEIRIHKRRKGKARKDGSSTTSRNSSAMAGSSHSTHPTNDQALEAEHTPGDAGSLAAIDPAAIVRMALSLNESRRLSLSPGRLVSNPSPVGRRASARIETSPTTAQGHFSDHRKSLRQSMRSRSGSRKGSPVLVGVDNHNLRPVSSPQSMAQLYGNLDGVASDQDLSYSFSSATIARAEKARNFIELHEEYRRLLQVLPPLSPSAFSSKTPELGRQYNPLQYIRNRKIRGHGRQLLDPEGAGWNKLNEVKAWVDNTENEAGTPGYQDGDIAMLPPWKSPGQQSSELASDSIAAEPFGNPSAGAKPKRPKLDWTFTPSDLLADAHWLEQNTNKANIETRDGHKIFTRLKLPESAEYQDTTRVSYESVEDSRGDYSFPTQHDFNQSLANPSRRERETGITNEFGSETETAAQNQGNIARVKRRLLRRRRNVSADTSFSSGSDDEGVDANRDNIPSLGRKLGVNIGPLEKHMNAILRTESSNIVDPNSLQPQDTTLEESQQRRGGVSSEYQGQSRQPLPGRHRAPSQGYTSLRSSIGTDPVASPRISVEDVDGSRTYMNGFVPDPPEGLSPQSSGGKRLKTRPLDLFRRGKSKEHNNIDENDFALQQQPPKTPDSTRSSLNWSSRLNSRNGAITSNNSSRRESEARANDQGKISPTKESPGGSTARFFKGGRVGDIIRGEKSHIPGFGRKKESPPHSKSGAETPGSISEDNDESLEQASSNEPKRSQSDTDLSKAPKYHVKNLPTFRSANAPPLPETKPEEQNFNDDHIHRQMRERREQELKRKSRKAYIGNELSVETSPDVSPNTSSYNLTQLSTADSFRTPQTESWTADSHPSSEGAAAHTRLRKLLREPGGVGKGGLPMTGLARVDAMPSKGSRLAQVQGSWDSHIDAKTSDAASKPTVTARDINHVRSLLLASGVKAHAIVRRADELRDPPSDYFVRAARAAGITPKPVARRQEHVVAARILSNSLERAAEAFGTAADDFRTGRCQALQRRVDDLRERVNAGLTPQLQSCADEADAFIARLTTSHTLAVKQISDGVDEMMRSRWRRLRMLRRAGFKVLEWLLVALMWWIWLFVRVFQMARGTVVHTGRAVRWLLWL